MDTPIHVQRNELIEISSPINTQSADPTEDEFFSGYYSPLFQIIVSVVLGIIFSPFSLGFLIFLAVYIIMELWYAQLRGFRYTPAEISMRFLVFLMGLLGFLYGRITIGDLNAARHHYDEWSL